ncbi:MAG TPA: TIGR00341 family protein [Thermodesulfobacteriota bacterium]|nr:TIGR00341 family protein [Thermodesulfobacteriota bacterium]
MDTTKLSKVYIILVILSSIVAAVGILRDNVAVIIGAMVIAPLLGPNIALSFATTLGDMDLVQRAMKANLVGLLIAFIFSALIGFIFEINPEVPELSSRTNVGLADVALALASGSTGVLSFTAGVGSAIVGVMVAVALLPPLVSFGMLLGSAHFNLALGAMLLLLVNVICVNLAGVTTFLAQGIRPKTWWEADRAKKATRVAILLWTFLLLVLIVAILLSQKKVT